MKKFFKYFVIAIILFRIFVFPKLVDLAIYGYTNSWDLEGVPVEVVFEGENLWLSNVSPNGRYGIAYYNKLLFFEEENYIELDFYIGQFITDRFITITDSGGIAEGLYDFETGDMLPFERIKFGDNWIDEFSKIYASGGKIINHASSRFFIVENEHIGYPQNFITLVPFEEEDNWIEAPTIGYGTCILDCLPNRDRYLVTPYVYNLEGERIFSIFDLATDKNPFFQTKFLTLVGWSSDGNYVYAAYGRPWLYEDLISFGIGSTNYTIPRRIIKIPIPFP